MGLDMYKIRQGLYRSSQETLASCEDVLLSQKPLPNIENRQREWVPLHSPPVTPELSRSLTATPDIAPIRIQPPTVIPALSLDIPATSKKALQVEFIGTQSPSAVHELSYSLTNTPKTTPEMGPIRTPASPVSPGLSLNLTSIPQTIPELDSINIQAPPMVPEPSVTLPSTTETMPELDSSSTQTSRATSEVSSRSTPSSWTTPEIDPIRTNAPFDWYHFHLPTISEHEPLQEVEVEEKIPVSPFVLKYGASFTIYAWEEPAPAAPAAPPAPPAIPRKSSRRPRVRSLARKKTIVRPRVPRINTAVPARRMRSQVTKRPAHIATCILSVHKTLIPEARLPVPIAASPVTPDTSYTIQEMKLSFPNHAASTASPITPDTSYTIQEMKLPIPVASRMVPAPMTAIREVKLPSRMAFASTSSATPATAYTIKGTEFSSRRSSYPPSPTTPITSYTIPVGYDARWLDIVSPQAQNQQQASTLPDSPSIYSHTTSQAGFDDKSTRTVLARQRRSTLPASPSVYSNTTSQAGFDDKSTRTVLARPQSGLRRSTFFASPSIYSRTTSQGGFDDRPTNTVSYRPKYPLKSSTLPASDPTVLPQAQYPVRGGIPTASPPAHYHHTPQASPKEDSFDTPSTQTTYPVRGLTLPRKFTDPNLWPMSSKYPAYIQPAPQPGPVSPPKTPEMVSPTRPTLKKRSTEGDSSTTSPEFQLRSSVTWGPGERSCQECRGRRRPNGHMVSCEHWAEDLHVTTGCMDGMRWANLREMVIMNTKLRLSQEELKA